MTTRDALIAADEPPVAEFHAYAAGVSSGYVSASTAANSDANAILTYFRPDASIVSVTARKNALTNAVPIPESNGAITHGCWTKLRSVEILPATITELQLASTDATELSHVNVFP